MVLGVELSGPILSAPAQDNHKVAIEEHIRVFLLGLSCKKKWIVGEGAYACLAHSPTSPNEQNCALPWTGQIQKTSKYVLSKQEGNELAKNHLMILSL
jgi:hypothetical protein